MIDQICQECQTPFLSKTPRARFCSKKCVRSAWLKLRPGYGLAANRRYLASDPEHRERAIQYGRAYSQRPEVKERKRERQRASYHRRAEEKRKRYAAFYASRKRFLNAIKTTCGCLDCGRTDGTLAFDHRPGVTKLFELSDCGQRSLRVVLAEIDKCDVRCASCHAKRHEAVKRELRQTA